MDQDLIDCKRRELIQDIALMADYSKDCLLALERGTVDVKAAMMMKALSVVIFRQTTILAEVAL